MPVPPTIIAMKGVSSTNIVADDNTNNKSTTAQPPATKEALRHYSAGTSYGRLCGTSDPDVLVELSS